MKNKEPEQYRCKVEIKHEFTTDEWKEKTGHLTRRLQQLEQKEADVKAAAAVAKSAIKQLKSDILTLSHHVNDGYEMQTVEAVARFNRKKGSKKIFHHCPGNKDLHGKLIREEPMTEDDFKLLPLGDNIEETAPGAPQADGSVKNEAAASDATAEEAQEEEPAGAE